MDVSVESEPALNTCLYVADDIAMPKVTVTGDAASVKPEIEKTSKSKPELFEETQDPISDTPAKRHLERMRRLNEAFNECLKPEPSIKGEVENKTSKKFSETIETHTYPATEEPLDPKPEIKNRDESIRGVDKAVESKPEIIDVKPKPEAKKPVESKPEIKKSVESKPEIEKSVESKPEVKKSADSNICTTS
jgi:hypothetical protein